MAFWEKEEYGRSDDTETRVKQRDNNFVWWVRGNSESQGWERGTVTPGPAFSPSSMYLIFLALQMVSALYGCAQGCSGDT